MDKRFKYKPARDLPLLARKLKTLKPSTLAKAVLDERNEEITDEAVRIWFKRHPREYTELTIELQANVVTIDDAVDPSTFDNGTFDELPSVRTWIQEMEDRILSPSRKSKGIQTLKRICKGLFPKMGINLVAEGLWSYKHPDRLTLSQCQDLIRILRERGKDTADVRLVARNFLASKGEVVGQKISGAKSKGFGKLADLFVDINKLKAILKAVRISNAEAYAVDLFMFKTGTRIEATLAAEITDINWQDNTIKVTDKGRHSTGRKTWTKHLDPELQKNIKTIIGDRQTGKIFSLKKAQMSTFNRAAMRKVIPDLEPKIPMPNHFWRHMFFQHMLRLTDWNYAVAANLGGSTIKSLEESYGKPPQAIVAEWGLKYYPVLKVA